MKVSVAELEEKGNMYSHGVGVILGLLGTIYLLILNSKTEKLWPLFIYAGGVIFLFIASTLYHAVIDAQKKIRLRVLDHIAIYYLIAGTYTPVCLWVLQGSKGKILLLLVWIIALVGTVLKLFFTGKFEVFSLALYGIMGWLVILDLHYLIEEMPSVPLFFLTMGGAFYTIGMVFYAVKKIPYNHFIWHLFVLGGAISHWFMIKNLL